jgi:crossover junction endodeoxyribonuclease RuvC
MGFKANIKGRRMIYCGIDPGMSGAIALYNPKRDWLEVHDCPVLKPNGKSEMVLPSVVDILESVEIHGCIIERSQAMPGQGVTSMFSYGTGYGSYLGILAALKIPYTKIGPAEWKKRLRVPSEKDGARARASEIFPNHTGKWPNKGHHGRAEAALIAWYGANHA